MSTKDFKVIIPAELSKGADGEWIVQGLASTSSRDQQGEVILPEGIDATPIDEGRGVLNWDHQKGPENTLGLLDSYTKTAQGFFIKGRLFKNHAKAKSVQEIMSSLGKSDHGRMGLSVEGKILERTGKDGKIIKKCQINAVALTMNPVNQDSYVDLVKSMNTAEMDFQATEENLASIGHNPEEATFTTKQVMSLIEKALALTDSSASKPPVDRKGGDAIAMESCEEEIVDASKPKAKKKMKVMEKSLYKSAIYDILNKIQELYPQNSRTELWSALQDRLNKKFPELTKDDN